MTITSARYADETSIPVIITEDTGQELTMPAYPSETYYDAQMAEFLESGGVIDPYDPYYKMSLDKVKEIGYSEVDLETVSRVKLAEHNPAIGVILSDSDTNRENHKRDNKAKKKKNKISDADDHLFDHTDALYDFGETLRDQIEACNDNACIQAVLDSIPTAAWPKWVPI